ncbi:unnamed protein product [Microthlaspi erraticum]|uniref:DYW domain-containing protein n=1 Tax=Microthlaspi erraticum TaxID=1685480 RepID=A0A6D2IR02_9BRAS|nr:unnamed protein product [Microthlaspi erraticum]
MTNSAYKAREFRSNSVVGFSEIGHEQGQVENLHLVSLSKHGKLNEALEFFQEMDKAGVSISPYSYQCLFEACRELRSLSHGRLLHDRMRTKCENPSVTLQNSVLQINASIETGILNMYVKCGWLVGAKLVFDQMAVKLNFGKQVHASVAKLGMESEVSLGTPLGYFYIKCSSFEGYRGNIGGQVHADVIKRSLVGSQFGKSALYLKCGCLDDAREVFESMDNPDIVSWTAFISGHAYYGNASEALRLFEKMVSCGMKPNSVTFIAVLTACSHAGLVAEGKHYLDTMLRIYKVAPTIDHYDCMIDIYSRAGQLDEALKFMKDMPCEPDAMSWKCFLSGCWTHKNLELGEIAGEELRRLDPEDTAGYVLPFNLYTQAGKWEEAAEMMKLMNERMLKKELSCSWIREKGKIHRFIVGDKHHPQTHEIYEKLKEFDDFMEGDVFQCSMTERREQLLDHSERLAIAFGLISANGNARAPIKVFKNLRACPDCHEFAKHVSLVTGHEIVIRRRFHHFKEGKYSCND